MARPGKTSTGKRPLDHALLALKVFKISSIGEPAKFAASCRGARVVLLEGANCYKPRDQVIKRLGVNLDVQWTLYDA